VRFGSGEGCRRAPFWRNRSVIDRLYRIRHALPGGGLKSRWRSAVVSSNRKSQIGDRKSSLTVIDKCGQATKGVWWMSWHREATKDVVACDKLREAGKRASIRRFLN